MSSLPAITPMSPTLTKPFHKPGWLYEEKVDGWRMLAYKSAAAVRLVSRNGVGLPERVEARYELLVRERLERELNGAEMVYPVRRLGDDGLKAWAHVLKRQFEGLVAKDPESPYVGGRTRLWLKVKRPGAQSEHRWQGLYGGQ